MPSTFTYPLTSFTSGLSENTLAQEINDAAISPNLINVEAHSAIANGSVVLGSISVGETAQTVEVTINFDANLSAGEEVILNGLISAHPGIELQSQDISTGLVAFFMKHLIDEGIYSETQITTGFITSTYSNYTDLPNPPPSGLALPAFAAVEDDVGNAKLAYWDFIGQVSWSEVSFPWGNSIVAPEYLIVQNSSVGSGSNGWTYAMGPEFRILPSANGGTISNMSIKVATTNGHAWSIRRSTVVGPTAPALNTYTNIVASGTFTNTVINDWEVISGFTPVSIATNEWYVAQIYVGTGGQSFSIGTGTNLNQNLAEVNGGSYVFIGGSNPGSTSPPTTRAGTMYGLCSPEISPA